MYLAAAGIGTLGIADDDKVTLSNLQRQVIFKTEDVGKPKAEIAARAVAQLNPHVTAKPHNIRVDARNALELIGQYDLVVDGSDNFATRYLVSDACYFARKPLITAALGVFDGSITTIRAHEKKRKWQAQSDLSLPVSGAAAAGHGAGLRGSRDSRGVARRAWLADGA